MKTASKSTTTQNLTIELSAADIKDYLICRGKINAKDAVRVLFNVPGGGDWSNMSIDISEEDPIVACVTRIINK